MCLGSKNMRLGFGEKTHKTKFKSEARNRIWNGPEDSADPFISQKKKFFQSTLCGYSKLVSCDAWCNAKDEKLIRSSWAEKTSKNCWKLDKIKYCNFSAVFGRFLSPGWSDQFFVFCVASGVTRYKFRVPTKRTFDKLIFWLIKGSALSSGPFQIRFRASDLNFVFCVCSPKPNRTFLEPRQIRYWEK